MHPSNAAPNCEPNWLRQVCIQSDGLSGDATGDHSVQDATGHMFAAPAPRPKAAALPVDHSDRIPITQTEQSRLLKERGVCATCGYRSRSVPKLKSCFLSLGDENASVIFASTWWFLEVQATTNSLASSRGLSSDCLSRRQARIAHNHELKSRL